MSVYKRILAQSYYILDKKEIHGKDFPGETFRVLKEMKFKWVLSQGEKWHHKN